MLILLRPIPEGRDFGLAIVKSLLELHGGTICVESTIGAGCRFQITLPCEGR